MTEAAQPTTSSLPNGVPRHRNFPGHANSIVTVLRADTDNIYSADEEGFIHVYETSTGRLKKRLDGHTSGIWSMQRYNHILVSGSTDYTIRVWDLQSLRQAYVFPGHTLTVRALEIVEPVLNQSTGEYEPPYPMIVTGSRDATLRVWKLPEIEDAFPSPVCCTWIS